MSNFSREEVVFGRVAYPFEKGIEDVTGVVRGHNADKNLPTLQL